MRFGHVQFVYMCGIDLNIVLNTNFLRAIATPIFSVFCILPRTALLKNTAVM